MLELIMTRFLPTDVAVRDHAAGLRFLVLDELHTYRGRQGADVAMLVRRVRQRFNENLLCIGTSATMASEGDAESRAKVVARVATRLFGVEVAPANIITETLHPVTADNAPIDRSALGAAIAAGVPAESSAADLAAHPVAAWIGTKAGVGRAGRQAHSYLPPAHRRRGGNNADGRQRGRPRCVSSLSRRTIAEGV